MDATHPGHTKIRGVLIDLGGVVYVGASPIAGAVHAIARLHDAGLPIGFITNTTRRCRRQVIDELRRMGIRVAGDELLTPALMARAYLQRKKLSAHLIVHPDLEEDFAGLPAGGRCAVVVGDAGEHFTYARLNAAYRELVAGADLLALAMNRNFMDADGALSLDAGAFVTALEYASRKRATLFGKPSAPFFSAALDSLGCARDDVVMIGDDAESDVAGAIGCGIRGILVQTGKYHTGDETRIGVPPTHVARALDDAVSWILQDGGREK